MNKAIRRWGAPTKRSVVLILLVLAALVIYRFHPVISPLVIALLVAFILDPVADFLTDRLGLPRAVATGLIFLVLILAILGMLASPAALVRPVQQFIETVRDDFEDFATQVDAFLQQPLKIGVYSFDLSDVYAELSGALTSFARSVAKGTVDVAVSIASGAFWLVFILMAAFYLIKDADRLVERFEELAPPGYRDDLVRLRQQITQVWNAFLRGQLLLGLAMAVMTAVVCSILRLSYPVVLGLLAGVMEFLPSVGPFIAAVPAVLVALFQKTTFLGMSNVWYAVLVAGAYIVIQQIEGNLLVPRILGRSLNLHPLVVLIGIIVGGNLAGLLGMLLAAPVLATLRVLGYYVFCRLYDRDPFARLEREVAEPPQPDPLKRAYRAIVCWVRERIAQDAECPEPTGAAGGPGAEPAEAAEAPEGDG
jgi:predicted PurR-regulated permease PerM